MSSVYAENHVMLGIRVRPCDAGHALKPFEQYPAPLREALKKPTISEF